MPKQPNRPNPRPSPPRALPGRTHRLLRLGLFALTLGGALFLVGPLCAAPMLEIHFLDVGQGDAVLVRSPSGKVALIDTGPPSATPKLSRHFRRLKIKRINLFLISHPHLDHYGAWRALRGSLMPKVYIDPMFPHPSPMYRKLLRFIKRQKITTYKGRVNQYLDLGGGVRLHVIAPRKPFLRRTRSDANANSIVIRLMYKRLRVLLTGDAELPTEYRLMRRPEWLPSHLLKVAHHGSGHSTSRRFLRYVRPKFAVVSCGRRNRYGHPHPKTLGRLRNAAVETYVTAHHGTITARSNGTRLWISTHNGPQRKAPRSVALPVLPRAYEDPIKINAAHKAKVHGGALYNKSGPPLGQQPEKPRWLKHKPSGRRVIPPAPFPSRRGYVAAKRSRYFHRRSCRQAKAIPKNKRRYFRTRRAAIRSRRTPASDCFP